MAYIYATEKEETYITCELLDLDTSYSYNDRYIKWYYNDTYKGRSTLRAHASSGGEFTANNLRPGTRYFIEAEVYGQGKVLATLTGWATTKEKPLAPEFEWDYAGIQNGVPVKGERKIAGLGFYLTAREWNRLADNVRDKMLDRDMDVSAYNFGYIYASQGEPFTARHFNYMRKAIGALSSTGLSDKRRGDVIRADDLNLLMDRNNRVR